MCRHLRSQLYDMLSQTHQIDRVVEVVEETLKGVCSCLRQTSAPKRPSYDRSRHEQAILCGY